jgi:methyltransferase (TIGR00027 family)
MEPGRASNTALRAALRRAVHQVLDRPPILDDPIAVPLLGQYFTYDPARETHPAARAFRAFMATRSRYAEDRVAGSVARGVAQYVILGAGLDTFAYRNPFPQIRVFEVDFPATQRWKRELLAEAAIFAPANLTYVPVDFERTALIPALAEAGFDASRPAFFCWLGVVPYLTLSAFRATLEAIASLAPGSAISFDYGQLPHSLRPHRRAVFEKVAERVAAAGEPFRLFFTPAELDDLLRHAGFPRFEQLDSAQLNDLYFAGRTDGLALPTPGLGMLATAWV